MESALATRTPRSKTCRGHSIKDPEFRAAFRRIPGMGIADRGGEFPGRFASTQRNASSALVVGLRRHAVRAVLVPTSIVAWSSHQSTTLDPAQSVAPGRRRLSGADGRRADACAQLAFGISVFLGLVVWGLIGARDIARLAGWVRAPRRLWRPDDVPLALLALASLNSRSGTIWYGSSTSSAPSIWSMRFIRATALNSTPGCRVLRTSFRRWLSRFFW